MQDMIFWPNCKFLFLERRRLVLELTLTKRSFKSISISPSHFQKAWLWARETSSIRWKSPWDRAKFIFSSDFLLKWRNGASSNQFRQASSKSLEWKMSPRLFNNYGMAANNSEFCPSSIRYYVSMWEQSQMYTTCFSWCSSWPRC